MPTLNRLAGIAPGATVSRAMFDRALRNWPAPDAEPRRLRPCPDCGGEGCTRCQDQDIPGMVPVE